MIIQMIAFAKRFDETNFFFFYIKNDELLEKYNKIWDKVSNSIKKGLDNEPVYNEEHLKNKIKSYEGKINTNFHNDGILKERSRYIFVSVILIESVLEKGKHYYQQVFLEECK